MSLKTRYLFLQYLKFKKSYAHPLEYFLGNFLPFIIGFMVLGKTVINY